VIVVDERLRQFVQKLEGCHQDAVQVAFRHSNWKDLRSVVAAAPWALQPPDNWQFITESHLQAMSLWIRRSVDRDDDAISIYKLIRRVAHGEVRLTRRTYVTTILDGTESSDLEFWERRANKDFDKWAGPGAIVFPQAAAERHQELLKRVCQPISNYVDRRLAHRDKRPQVRVHIRQLDRAFLGIMAAHKRYHVMITGVNYALDEPMLGLRWKDPLSTPWILTRTHEGLCMPLHPEGSGPPHRWNRRKNPGPWRE
jgi:hypothetical protein